MSLGLDACCCVASSREVLLTLGNARTRPPDKTRMVPPKTVLQKRCAILQKGTRKTEQNPWDHEGLMRRHRIRLLWEIIDPFFPTPSGLRAVFNSERRLAGYTDSESGLTGLFHLAPPLGYSGV